MSEVTLVEAPSEALRKSRNACTSGLVAVRVARYRHYGDGDAIDGSTGGNGEGALAEAPDATRDVEVFEDIADRVRTAARHGAPGFVFMAGRTAADPFAPEAHVQSATFLAMAAALESGVPVRFLTEGIPARGFAPLFRRYRDLVAGQVRFVGPQGGPFASLEPHAASVDARVRGVARIVEALGEKSGFSARLDPVIPGMNDDEGAIGDLLDALAGTGLRSVVASPLRFNVAGRERIGSAFGEATLAKVARHYIPGRARRRTASSPPQERLPLERETSLAWRLHLALEPRGLDLAICTCRDSRKAACGLGVGVSHRPAEDQGQSTLWAVS